jgi:hypothetical protein
VHRRTRLLVVEAFFVVVLAAVMLAVAGWSWNAVRQLLSLNAEPGDE